MHDEAKGVSDRPDVGPFYFTPFNYILTADTNARDKRKKDRDRRLLVFTLFTPLILLFLKVQLQETAVRSYNSCVSCVILFLINALIIFSSLIV